MSTMSTTNTKVTFTREQKDFLDTYFQQCSEQFAQNIMADEDEEMTVDTLTDMASDLFNTKTFKIGVQKAETKAKKATKTKKEKSDGPKRPMNAYLLWMKEESIRDYIKNDLDITENKAIVAKAGELWRKHQEDDSDTYQKYNELYQENKAAYAALVNELDEAGPAEESNSSKSTKGKTGGKKASIKENSPNEDSDSSNSSESSKSTTKGKTGGKKAAKSKTDKVYTLEDFETHEDLSINLGMTVRGGLTKDNKDNSFDNLQEAYEAMDDDSEACAIHLDKDGNFTLRKTTKMSKAREKTAPCVTWIMEDEDE